MALKIYDTLAPQGNYPAVKAGDVLMPDGSRLAQVAVLPEQDVGGFALNDPNGIPVTAVSDLTEPLHIGDTYRILWNGAEYNCTAVDGSPVTGAETVYLGNATDAGITGNNEPFVMIYLSGNLLIGAIDAEDADDTHHIGIYKYDNVATETYVKSYVDKYISDALGGDY